jgi:hypothetical protein
VPASKIPSPAASEGLSNGLERIEKKVLGGMRKEKISEIEFSS